MPNQLRNHMSLFIWASVLFAGNYMYAAVAIESYTPAEISFVRTALAAIFLTTVVLVKGDRLPRGWSVWVKISISAFLLNTAAFVGMAVAVTRITTVQTSIWNALVPLMTLLLVIIFVPEESPSRHRIAGLGLGLVGALVLAEPWNGLGTMDLFGTAAILISTLSYSAGLVYVRRNFGELKDSSMSLTAGQMISSAAQFAILVPWFHSQTFNPTLKTTAALVALGIVGTAMTFLLIQKLIRAVGASVAGDTTYLILFVALVLGVVVLGEPITLWQVIGAGCILLGLVVINRENKALAPIG